MTLIFFRFSFYCSFFNYEGRDDLNTNKSGPLSVRQRTANNLAFRWRAVDGPTLSAEAPQGGSVLP